jgi:hypothetical protein
MPYILEDDRTDLKWAIDELEKLIDNPGKLNYAITCICLGYIYMQKENYQHWNDVIGVLECSKQEMYRRFIAPYENKKIDENGDL